MLPLAGAPSKENIPLPSPEKPSFIFTTAFVTDGFSIFNFTNDSITSISFFKSSKPGGTGILQSLKIFRLPLFVP